MFELGSGAHLINSTLRHDISSDLHKIASLKQTIFALKLPTEMCAIRAISLLNGLFLGFSLLCFSITECSSRGKSRKLASWPHRHQLSYLLTHTRAEAEEGHTVSYTIEPGFGLWMSVMELAWEVSGGQETAFRHTFLVSDTAL